MAVIISEEIQELADELTDHVWAIGEKALEGGMHRVACIPDVLDDSGEQLPGFAKGPFATCLAVKLQLIWERKHVEE